MELYQSSDVGSIPTYRSTFNHMDIFIHMKPKQLREYLEKVIREIVSEANDFNEFDPEMWRQWLRTGEADFNDLQKVLKKAHKAASQTPRPGSDLDADSEIGATNFPKGNGYPNKQNALRGKKWKERINLDHFSDVPYKDVQVFEERIDKILVKLTGTPYYNGSSLGNIWPYWSVEYNLNNSETDPQEKSIWLERAQKIHKILVKHSITDYNIRTGRSNSYENELRDYYKSGGSWDKENEYMLIKTGVPYKQIPGQIYLNAYKFGITNLEWKNKLESIKNQLLKHGINDYNVNTGRSATYESIFQQVANKLPHPQDNITYPSYVSAYDTKRTLGGHEEGGWWYNDDQYITSIKVHNKLQAYKAALILFKEFSSKTDGIITIVAEKKRGGHGENQETPHYS